MKYDLLGKRILVTGGTGFIGASLVKGLVNRGALVRTLDNDSRGHRERLIDLADSIEVMTGDICDYDVVHKAVEDIDCVCHLAYVNGTEFFYSIPERVLEVAVKGMVNILDACRAHSVKNLVLASSSEVYQSPDQIPTDENVPLIIPDVMNPRYSYGGGKIICELMAINYGRAFFDRVIIFRPHNVYGPNMGNEHVIPQFASRMQKLNHIQTEGILDFEIQGTGKETRSFIYIDDFIEGVVLCIERGKHLNIYHIGTEQECSIESLANDVASQFGRRINIKPGETPKGSTSRRCPDTTKIRTLGFEPKTDLKTGLSRTIQWYTNHRVNVTKESTTDQHGTR